MGLAFKIGEHLTWFLLELWTFTGRCLLDNLFLIFSRIKINVLITSIGMFLSISSHPFDDIQYSYKCGWSETPITHSPPIAGLGRHFHTYSLPRVKGSDEFWEFRVPQAKMIKLSLKVKWRDCGELLIFFYSIAGPVVSVFGILHIFIINDCTFLWWENIFLKTKPVKTYTWFQILIGAYIKAIALMQISSRKKNPSS